MQNLTNTNLMYNHTIYTSTPARTDRDACNLIRFQAKFNVMIRHYLSAWTFSRDCWFNP